MNLISLDRQIELMLEFNISAEQWFFLTLVYLSQYPSGSKYLYKYYYERKIRHGIEPGVSLSMINDLLDKELLISDKGYLALNEVINFDELSINPEHRFFISLFPEAYDFWDMYPAFSQNAGTKYPLKGLSGSKLKNSGNEFNSKDDFLIFYITQIKGDRQVHELNMKALDLAIKQGLINFTIYDWVITEKWNDFQKEIILLDNDNI
jgi:hypothetical protein